ncbi:protocadherin alpha-2-like [Thalassophryne amazonica]|uniref:protocadherin alpha-2-like n=1 Tax=Thalassophryne amazonica TaxID=390379 RepID=UPI0014714A43|nr:protocadherin alpha-2-like [Thalassophryne amazonica]
MRWIMMKTDRRSGSRDFSRISFPLCLLLFVGKQALAEIRYSVPEEVKEGTVVGNVAKDLGFDVTSLTNRRFRVVSESEEDFFEVKQDSGALCVHKKIDREEVCQGSGACLMELKIIVENPLEMHYVAVEITDVNDHAPSFPEMEQTFEIAENTQTGKRFQLYTAHDPDAGMNSIRSYTLNSNDHFEVDLRQNDEDRMLFLVLKKPLDREQKNKHSLLVTAVDGGKPQRSGTLNVTIIVLDSNDNRPTFAQESYEISINENIPVGTLIFKMNVSDADEGTNGEIVYSLSKTSKRKIFDLFDLDMRSGEIRLKRMLDYEDSDVHKLGVEASDKGTPPSSGECRVIVKIIDINDNPPQIEITSLSDTMSEDSKPALKSFDFETLKSFQFQVVATDCGTPSLSSNVTVNVFILDQNDNPPVILYPVSANGSAEGVEEIPRNVNAGHLVTKVRAYDADIGYNGWLLFSLQELTDHILFALDRYTGQIRTLRSFTETDEAEHKLVILVKDNGNVSLSATATVTVKLVEPKEAFAASDVKGSAKDEEDNNVTFYLMITLGSVSTLLLISIIVLIAMQCSKSTDYSSKYLQEANYNGTLCNSIQYRSGEKRYMLVGPRMSIGSTIVPGSNANTLVVPDRRQASAEMQTFCVEDTV